jgi:3-hydroxyisobutyrate dehydrogenase
MAKIAFIGLGNMGGPMAANLVKGQHQVTAFDLSATALDGAVEKGAKKAASAAEAVKGAEVVVTMLPAGRHVRGVYENDVLPNVAKGTLLIDCSTIDVDSARHVGELAAKAGLEMVDAPVGTLTFMVGGGDGGFAKARPILEKMGKNIVHTGPMGAGQAAKICNNMILGITMIGVAEGFLLGKRLGLDVQKLFDIVSTSSGSCWAVNNYLPLPGPVPTSPANRDYQAGFTADNMLKDLKLAQQAAQTSGASTPMGAEAAQLFNMFVNAGGGAKDFSGIIKMLEGK